MSAKAIERLAETGAFEPSEGFTELGERHVDFDLVPRSLTATHHAQRRRRPRADRITPLPPSANMCSMTSDGHAISRLQRLITSDRTVSVSQAMRLA
jgi:hypothetical protein